MVGLLPMKKASYRSQVLNWLNLHLVKLRNYDSIIVRFFDRSVKQLHARRADQRCLAFIQIYITRYLCILKKSKQFIEEILGPSFLKTSEIKRTDEENGQKLIRAFDTFFVMVKTYKLVNWNNRRARNRTW